MQPLPDSFASTRESLHALAEHVLAPARYRAEGRIGLMPTPGGFGTPGFGEGERIRVDQVELVHERPGATTRVGLTTLLDAAQFVGVPLGAPQELYVPSTMCLPDAPLGIQPDAARALADWFALAASALDELREAYGAFAPTELTIWPEHFDLACALGDADAGTRANYGASPGDRALPQPYLYVGPWEASRRTGRLAAYPFGAALTYADLAAAPNARACAAEFFFEGAALLLGQP